MDPNTSLEQKNRAEKIDKLAEELFHNVSYFNVISIFVIVVSLSFFIFGSKNPDFVAWLDVDMFSKYEPYIQKTMPAFKYIYVFLFYSLVVESIYTFLRIVGRVIFLFDEKIDMR
ncbi:MAG: hypothetical protein V7727_03345 [Sneathiella sp.]